MATNNKTLTTVTLSSAEFAAIGLPLDTSAANVKLSNAANTQAGAACVNGDPLVSVAVATIRSDLHAAETGVVRAAIGLALLEEHDAWRGITAPDGKPFRNVQAFRRVVFAGYDESNVRKYADAGRRVYLAALRGELDDLGLPIVTIKDGQIIQALPMRTAAALKAGLNDAETRKALPASIKEHSVNGKITFRGMSDAVKSAKDNSGETPNDSDTPVANPQEVDAAVISAETKRVFNAFKNEDELTIAVDSDYYKRMAELLSLVGKNGDNALLFVKELTAIINAAV